MCPHRAEIEVIGKDDDGLYRVAWASFAVQPDPAILRPFPAALLHSNAFAVCWID